MAVAERALWAVAALCSGFAAIALLDWQWELNWGSRAVLLGLLTVATVAAGLASAVLAWRRCDRERVAVLLETRFPQLGQSVRTAVQFELPHAQPTLLGLQNYVIRRTEALQLEKVQPTQRLLMVGALAPVIVLPLMAGGGLVEQFQTALRRAALQDVPYTVVAVKPGDTLVDEFQPLAIEVEISGRAPRNVVVESRAVGETAWQRHTLESSDPAARMGPVTFKAEIAPFSRPLEYRVAAGRGEPQVYRADMRPALRLTEVTANVEPPPHLQLPASTNLPGDFEGVEGSTATLSVRFDRPARNAVVVVRPVGRSKSADEVERLPMQAAGDRFVVRLPLTRHSVYSIEAEGLDGARIAPNEHRIRVQADDPPELRFESPTDPLEVHALAELPLRLQARDDYGLERAGIVLQINEREVEIQATDFAEPSVRLTKLTKLLPLELFELTQRDSVSYYGFAEDRRADGLARSETELRYLDIRPFRRIYRNSQGGGGGGGGGGPGLASLNELIANQRFLINRTLRLERGQKRNAPDLHGLDQVVTRQARLADSARALAARVAEADIDGADLLFQAEASMLKAIDFLSQSDLTTGAELEKEALRLLIEGRNELEIALSQGNPNTAAALRQFDREQMRRLRSQAGRSQLVRELVQALRRLALRQQDVGRRLETLTTHPPDAESMDTSTGEMEAVTAEQLDIDLELESVVRELEQLPGMSEVLRRRGQRAAEESRRLAETLERRDLGAAAEIAPRQPDRLRMLARHLSGAALPDSAERLAVARDLAADLALRERELRARLKDEPMSATKGETVSEALQSWAGDGEAVVDILRAVIASAESAGDEMNQTSQRLEALLAELNLDEARAEIERLSAQLDKLPVEERTQAMAAFAERLELAAQRLDALHRWLVEPRLEQLRAFESRGQALREEANRPAENATGRWRRQLDALVRDLVQAEVVAEQVEKLQAALVGTDAETAPSPAALAALDQTLAELRRQIQELVLGDVLLGREEPVPAQYRKLVEQYLRSLSTPSDARDTAEPKR